MLKPKGAIQTLLPRKEKKPNTHIEVPPKGLDAFGGAYHISLFGFFRFDGTSPAALIAPSLSLSLRAQRKALHLT